MLRLLMIPSQKPASLLKIYAFSGSFAYWLLLPLIRLVIKRTSRAYVLLEHKGEILMIKNALSRQNWQLPGGGLKIRETPVNAAVRELNEEVNITLSASSLTLVSEGRWLSDSLGYYYYIFVARCDNKPAISLRSFENIQSGWFNYKQLSQETVAVEVLSCIKSAGL